MCLFVQSDLHFIYFPDFECFNNLFYLIDLQRSVHLVTHGFGGMFWNFLIEARICGCVVY